MKLTATQDIQIEGKLVRKGEEFSATNAGSLIAHGYATATAASTVVETATAAPVAETAARKPAKRATVTA
jgi:hypothetical protein